MFNFYLQVDIDDVPSYVIPSAAMDKPISFTSVVLTSNPERDPKFLWTWKEGRIVSLYTGDCWTIEDDNLILKQINLDERQKDSQQWKLLRDGRICTIDNSKFVCIQVDNIRNFDNCPLQIIKFFDNDDPDDTIYCTWKVVTHHPDFTQSSKNNR